MVPPQVDTGFIINLPFWAPYGLECMQKFWDKSLQIVSEPKCEKIGFGSLLRPNYH